MTTTENQGLHTIPSIRDSISRVITRISTTARRRGATSLPDASFSNALNAFGETFVDLLLQQERRGRWWLDETGEWLECSIRSEQRRRPRVFLRGDSEEWAWYPPHATRLADPLTGPDHVVLASIPALKLTAHVVLEQKLRFGCKQDAFASGSTYAKHLLSRSKKTIPRGRDFDCEGFCSELLGSLRRRLCKTKNGRLTYSGSVPHVCFVSLATAPHVIYVKDKAGMNVTPCQYVGFLPPSVDRVSFTRSTPALQIIHRARTRLWVGLDDLLDQCTTTDVDAAWNAAIREATASIHTPSWNTD